jgi:hypothetical protein
VASTNPQEVGVLVRLGFLSVGRFYKKAQEGDLIILSSVVINSGAKLGTAYVRFLIADSYRRDDALAFDSDNDLSENERRTLRLVDIPVGESRRVACSWRVPPGSVFEHFDICVEVWNPHRLFKGRWPFLFHTSGWLGGFEVISAPSTASLKAFVSYSWDNDIHKAWVRDLAEELPKYGIDTVFDQKDLFPGEEATHFMERGISECTVTLLICSETYTQKADDRQPGGVGFETVLSSHEYMIRPVPERARFIPLVRDNNLPPGRKLPKYLGSSIYIDMSSAEWQAEPMQRLVQAIRRFACT